MQTSISIALATYNGEKYLSEQLNSFLRQTLPPDELVVCDDCSEDNTLGILNEFSKSAPFPVKIFVNQQNLGYSQNFEKALSLCTGDIVFLSDQDDAWFPMKLETVIAEFAQNTKTKVIVNDMIIADELLSPSTSTQLGNILAARGNSDDFYSGCCVAIRKDFLGIVLPFPEGQFAHDNWINHLAQALNVRVLLPVALQLYRRHGDNASKWILSSPRGVSQFRMLRATGLKSSTNGWQDQLERYRHTKQRIVSVSHALEQMDLAERQYIAMKFLGRRMTNLEARMLLASKPRIIRWPNVISFWLSGGYTDYATWKSALKDLIRP